MNLLTATPPPTGAYDSAADPVLQYITLGVAALAILWSGVTAYRQNKLTSTLWLRTKRQEVYTDCLAAQTRLSDALHKLHMTYKHDPEYAAQEKEVESASTNMGQQLGAVSVVGSPSVVALLSQQIVLNTKTHSAIGKATYYISSKEITEGQAKLSVQMSHEVQARKIWSIGPGTKVRRYAGRAWIKLKGATPREK